MEKLRIVWCDENRQELEKYTGFFSMICERNGVHTELKYYSNSHDLMFDMEDDEFSTTADMLVIDPANGFAAVPATVRKQGYDGIILYLSGTESAEYYRQAFDAGAYNFIQKGSEPSMISRFQAVFESAIQTARQANRRYIAVSYKGEYKRIAIKDIRYFEAGMDHMINVVYNGGSFQFSSTLQSLEDRLRNCGFVRVHRSYLVSVDAIHRVGPNELVLNDGQWIPVSRGNSGVVKSALAFA